jgi:hypothetical protein
MAPRKAKTVETVISSSRVRLALLLIKAAMLCEQQ